MVKLRCAGYSNLKLFLLYLVVYGHWIERDIDSSNFLEMQYRWIYLIHMPLFAFLTGLFLRSQKDCLRQIRRLLPIYLLLQLIARIFSGNAISLLAPWWHLWYLLSACLWIGLGWLWFRFGLGRGKLLILALAILVGGLSGYASWLNRTLSGSRTVVFFPYFWAGLICDPEIPWQKYRRWGLTLLALAAVLMGLWGGLIPINFLYQAEPYGRLKNGFGLRLLCYGLGGLLGFFLLTVIPARRLPCTRAGADTLPGYLIHGPIVGVLREVDMPWGLCALSSVLLLYVIYKILQWGSPLYGIVPGERRAGIWPDLRKSTNNMANRYTDSSSP